jgi:hypothetical protein
MPVLPPNAMAMTPEKITELVRKEFKRRGGKLAPIGGMLVQLEEGRKLYAILSWSSELSITPDIVIFDPQTWHATIAAYVSSGVLAAGLQMVNLAPGTPAPDPSRIES